MKPFSATLFDLDGTLIDSAGDLAAALNILLAQDGLAALPAPTVLTMIGDGATKLIERGYHHHGQSPPADAVTRFRTHYQDCCLTTTHPYPGIPELLERLDDTPMAVATNKPTAFAQQILSGLGLAPHFRSILGPDSVPRKKPAPEHLIAALEQLDCRPEQAVMVGDSPADILAGRAAGVTTLAVLWGYRSREALTACQPDHLVASVAELTQLLTGSG